jgi:3-dehydroquinate dehydratase/shikimate dehydrogenase
MKKLTVPRIAIAATGESPRELFDCARTALETCRFVELRLDWLPRPERALPIISKLLEECRSGGHARPVILQATCRRVENGGRFRGTVAAQLEILRKAAEHGCRLVDLEIESAETAGAEAVRALREKASLILSWHDFHRTPPLDPIARRLRRFPADYYKVVPTATRQSDNCRALKFLERMVSEGRGRECWVVMAMEQSGVPSRVLALARGSSFVYASLPQAKKKAAAQAAAPGQVDIETLRRAFRAERLGPKTAIYGLLGWPIGHSVGAAIHNACFGAKKMDAVYLPLLASDLNDFRDAARLYPLAGFSVTIPHKQGILRFIDRIDPVVKMAGAANTVRIRRGRWEAINSDVEGIAGPLRKTFRLQAGKGLGKNFRAVVVGTGGAARAALAALKQLKCRQIFVAGRNPKKAKRLCHEFGATALALAALGGERFDLMIHATPVGMWPRTEECPLTAKQINAECVFDLVYNPRDTRLLQLARSRGCRTISGLEMFLAQAARQFEFWTGEKAPRALMRRTAERELARFASTVVSR